MRRILIGAIAAAAMVGLSTGPAAAVDQPTHPGFSNSGTAVDLSGTPLATFAFNHVDDSLTICDLLDDGRKAVGTVNHVEQSGPGSSEIVVDFTVVDDTPDGRCVTGSIDLIEGKTHTAGVQMFFSDGTSAGFSDRNWVIA